MQDINQLVCLLTAAAAAAAAAAASGHLDEGVTTCKNLITQWARLLLLLLLELHESVNRLLKRDKTQTCLACT